VNHDKALASKIVVLEATAPPKATTEYVDQVVRYADPVFDFRYLNPHTAVLRADVFHVHWPELIVRGGSKLETYARCLGLQMVLALMRRRGTAIVRTLHNLEPHEMGDAVERWALAKLDARTDLFIRINAETPAPFGQSPLIPHGHYRDAYERYSKPPPIAGRIVFAGRIRPFKGVESLITAFRTTTSPSATLRIVGIPTPELEKEISNAATIDPRISVKFGYVPDEEFVAEVSRAEVVCLPYDDIHNSGALLAALSLDRPTLVRDTPTTRALADEAGPGWVHLFTGELTSADLDRVLDTVKNNKPAERPRLQNRDWQCVGEAYSAAFFEAKRLVGERKRGAYMSV
jgi:beta-1,4-mannosyltransferase